MFSLPAIGVLATSGGIVVRSAGYDAAVARIGLVLGAGGVVGAAFHDGVLAALRDATGWDPREADVIVGTSAGSHVGARLRAGRAPGRAARRGAPTVPTDRTVEAALRPASPGALVRGLVGPGRARLTATFAALLPAGRVSLAAMIDEINALHPDGWPDRPLWLPAVRLRDGRRVVFGRDEAAASDVGHAVAASCAIPGWFSPVNIAGDRYVDGGAHSTTNLDVLAGEGLDLVVVSAPMGVARGAHSATAALQARGFMRWRLANEARAVRRGGARVVAFSPTAQDLEVMGWNAMAQGRRGAVIERAYASASRRLARPQWRDELAALVEAA